MEKEVKQLEKQGDLENYLINFQIKANLNLELSITENETLKNELNKLKVNISCLV